MHPPRPQRILHVIRRPAVDPPLSEHFLQQALVVDPSVSHAILLVVVADSIVAQLRGGNLPCIKRKSDQENRA
jgi:hypothetical protein